MSRNERILLTGAAGLLGGILTKSLQRDFDLILTDIRAPKENDSRTFIKADVTNLDAMRAACRGIDLVVHFAADPRTDAPWESLLPNNIMGTYNVFQAASEAGCRRIVFASSVNTVLGYPPDIPVSAHMPVRPPNLYGASKVWGETLARYYSDSANISCICLRIGWVKDPHNLGIAPGDPNLNLVITYRDLVKLILASIEAPTNLRFGVFHGISNNRYRQFDISEARRVLGFEPIDDAFALAEAASPGQKSLGWYQLLSRLKKKIASRSGRI
jgi:nucleoside-diphosphate-sugar epimerase